MLLSSVAIGQAADVVKTTPLGGQDGEFCQLDRAIIFEDPTGTRLLYDVGRTVAGANDPRRGKVDEFLVSHMLGDDVGNRHTKSLNAGTCSKPVFSRNATPNPNSVSIAVADKAKIVTGSEVPPLFAGKIKAAGGNAKDSMPARFGATKTIGGVGISTVPAVHSNGQAPEFIGGALGDQMKQISIAGYVGPAMEYLLKFTNGLVGYLSGDTSITAEQDLVVRDHYAAKWAAMNIGEALTTGPTEAAYVINSLVEPNEAIASHPNEPATKNGKVIPGARTEKFIKASKVPVHIPLSSKTMSFGGTAKCVVGCWLRKSQAEHAGPQGVFDKDLLTTDRLFQIDRRSRAELLFSQ